MRTTVFALAGASLLVAAGCRTPHEPTHYELAEKARIAGDNETALREYNEAVRLEPAHKHAWRNIGYILAEKQGGKEYTKKVRDAFHTYLMLETYEIGNVEGDPAMELPSTPEEPHFSKRMARNLSTVVRTIGAIEDEADVCLAVYRESPGDAELKTLAVEAQQAALDANMGKSARAQYNLGEIARLAGDEAAAKGHYEASIAEAKEWNRPHVGATAALGCVGGDLDEGWLAARELNQRQLYIDLVEAAIRKGELDRAVFFAREARKFYADITLWRKLAEAHLLKEETASANEAIGVLEKWPRADKEVETFLRICSAALSGQKTDDWAKKMTAGAGTFDGTRLAEKVSSSKADGAAKKAVADAAKKLAGK